MQSIASVFHEGTVTAFVRSEEHTFSTFGGPLELEVTGLPSEAHLHQLLHLNHNDLKAIAPPRYIWDLPLLYGMQHSGCELTYKFESGKVAIEHLSPRETTDLWPYRHYPSILPYYPLKVAETTTETWEQFIRRAPNLPEEQPAELVVLVPPPFGLGFTLWGRGGDAEEVVVVFEIGLTERRVRVYNVCS